MIVASRLSRSHRLVRRLVAPSGRCCVATYAESPGKWQTDPAVMMYGQLLAVRDNQEDAFLVAAETLRSQVDLPADLRASASRTRAGVLFKKAVGLFEELKIGLEAPWPEEAFEALLAAATKAVGAYAEALAETADPELRAAVEPHCPEWPDVLSATATAYTEALKLRAELRFRQMRWYTKQAEHAKVLGEAARRGSASADAASVAAEALGDAGLAATTEEQVLLAVAVEACDKLNVECVDTVTGGNGPDSVLRGVRQKALAYRTLVLKDLAIAHALGHDLGDSVKAAVSALDGRAEDILGNPDAAEQVKAMAQGVLELCGREMRDQAQSRAAEAAQWTASLAQAVEKFDAWRATE